MNTMNKKIIAFWKKFFIGLCLLWMTQLLILPVLVIETQAAGTLNEAKDLLDKDLGGTAVTKYSDVYKNIAGNVSNSPEIVIRNLVLQVTDIFVWLVTAVAVLFIIIAGSKMVVSGEDAAKKHFGILGSKLDPTPRDVSGHGDPVFLPHSRPLRGWRVSRWKPGQAGLQAINNSMTRPPTWSSEDYCREPPIHQYTHSQPPPREKRQPRVRLPFLNPGGDYGRKRRPPGRELFFHTRA